MSTFSALPGATPAWSPALDVVDPRPELQQAAAQAAAAIPLVDQSTTIAWRGEASEGYRALVEEAVRELHRVDRVADGAVGAATRYVRTVEAANAEASLR
ncbi:hypothetical protein ACFWFR_00735 [Oerskovia sp. NPDC060287]|uniref:hypothetical protein n=1 Tax=Oerskovia sp. NPDC060287 TaxID=3347095 RepID=UPI003667FB32